MIVQKTEPTLGTGRRLPILPQPSCPLGGGLTHYNRSRSKTSTNHMNMHTKCKRLAVYDALMWFIETPPGCSSEAYSRASGWLISINCDAYNEWESLNYPREYPDLIYQSLTLGSPPVSPRNSNRIQFQNQRIVPSLIRLVDDLTGKEVGWETNIGDKKNVTKYIN